jgi:hypothetical protein
MQRSTSQTRQVRVSAAEAGYRTATKNAKRPELQVRAGLAVSPHAATRGPRPQQYQKASTSLCPIIFDRGHPNGKRPVDRRAAPFRRSASPIKYVLVAKTVWPATVLNLVFVNRIDNRAGKKFRLRLAIHLAIGGTAHRVDWTSSESTSLLSPKTSHEAEAFADGHAPERSARNC